MPVIFKHKKKKPHSDKSKLQIHKLVYNTDMWRKLRNLKINNNPLCEDCIKKNKLVNATEVHHIQSITQAGEDKEKMYQLAFDYNNLISLCENCHKEKHNKNKPLLKDYY